MSKFSPNNHIIGKVYDLTQENFNALLVDWERLLRRESELENEVEYWARLAKHTGPACEGGCAIPAHRGRDCCVLKPKEREKVGEDDPGGKSV